jgi:nitric oxide reductase NorE protein
MPTCKLATIATGKSAKHLPGEAGIWLFILGDMMVFSLFFVTFMYYRGQELALFRHSHTYLNQYFGALNTFLMLSSSLFVATAIHAARKSLIRVTPTCFVLGCLCGVGFVLNKAFEYSEMIHQGFTLGTNDFFMYYYVFTGIHLMHVLIGIGVLLLAACYSWSGVFTPTKVRNLESGASFWHVVDLLWIVLFALLYLIN